MDQPINFARTPGSFTGTAPKRYDQGSERRRCACGAVISPYTKGAWCTTCDRNPDRMAHYARAPKEIPMEPAKLKAKQAADRLGVTGQQLKTFVREDRIKEHERGRGLFGSTYLEADVDRLKAELEAERLVADAATEREPVADPEPEFQVGTIAEDEPVDQDEPVPCCGNKDEGGCFGPDCTVELKPSRDAEPDAEPEDEPEDEPEARGFPPVFPIAMIAETVHTDPEIEAMYAIKDALEPLDRDARLRAVRWALSKFGLDRPEPQPETVTVRDGMGGTTELPVS